MITPNMDLIAKKGAKVYQKIKSSYYPKFKGKYLAINVKNGSAFLGDSTSDAVLTAKKSYPEEIFYVVKIGYSVAETFAKLTSNT